MCYKHKDISTYRILHTKEILSSPRPMEHFFHVPMTTFPKPSLITTFN